MTREELAQTMQLGSDEKIQAWLGGAQMQFELETGVWMDISDVAIWEYLKRPDKYRIKPAKKRVKLTANDIPPGSVIRTRVGGMSNCWDTICGVTAFGFFINDRQHFLSFVNLIDSELELSTDGGKTWKPTWKEIEV